MDKEIKEMFDKVFEKTDILLRRVEKIESGFKEDNKVEEPEAINIESDESVLKWWVEQIRKEYPNLILEIIELKDNSVHIFNSNHLAIKVCCDWTSEFLILTRTNSATITLTTNSICFDIKEQLLIYLGYYFGSKDIQEMCNFDSGTTVQSYCSYLSKIDSSVNIPKDKSISGNYVINFADNRCTIGFDCYENHKNYVVSVSQNKVFYYFKSFYLAHTFVIYLIEFYKQNSHYKDILSAQSNEYLNQIDLFEKNHTNKGSTK